jgi:hypothetical protein
MKIRLMHVVDGTSMEFDSFAQLRSEMRMSPQLFRSWLKGKRPKQKPWSEWVLFFFQNGAWIGTPATDSQPPKETKMKRVSVIVDGNETVYRSLSAAAKALNVSPPTVAKALAGNTTVPGVTSLAELPPQPGQFSGERRPERKVCPKCGLDLPASDYYANKARPDGLAYACRSCFKADVGARNKTPAAVQARKARRAAEATERINRRIKERMDTQQVVTYTEEEYLAHIESTHGPDEAVRVKDAIKQLVEGTRNATFVE